MLAEWRVSASEKQELWVALNEACGEGERDPQVVVESRYGGNREEYIGAMARYLGLLAVGCPEVAV